MARGSKPWALVAILLVVLVFLIAALWRRLRRPRTGGAEPASPGVKDPSPHAAAVAAADKDHFFRTYDLTGALTPGHVDPYTGLSWYNREEFADREKRGARALKDEMSILKLGLLA